MLSAGLLKQFGILVFQKECIYDLEQFLYQMFKSLYEFISVCLQGVKFAKVPAEEVVDISHRYSISAVPTIVILRRNKEVDRINGSNPAELVSKLKQHVCFRNYLVNTT